MNIKKFEFDSQLTTIIDENSNDIVVNFVAYKNFQNNQNCLGLFLAIRQKI